MNVIDELKNNNLKLVKNPPIIKISGLSKTFGEVKALKDITLEIPEGRIIGLLGPNGSGKTTLIKIMAGLYTSYAGQVTIDGKKPSPITKEKTAYLPDKNSFPLHGTVEEIIQIYRDFYKDFDLSMCREMLKSFEITGNAKIIEMSKGVIDKLQVSMTMSRKARLYLLDEPIGGVDIVAREIVLDTILESYNPKGTIIVATHLINEMERLFDSAIIINKGSLVAYDDYDILEGKIWTLLKTKK